eukprot:Hpha_TRINITY_DN7023_c0_g1::TRINITY_DN7023_c0_g1_i1::g.22964::m.22964
MNSVLRVVEGTSRVPITPFGCLRALKRKKKVADRKGRRDRSSLDRSISARSLFGDKKEEPSLEWSPPPRRDDSVSQPRLPSLPARGWWGGGSHRDESGPVIASSREPSPPRSAKREAAKTHALTPEEALVVMKGRAPRDDRTGGFLGSRLDHFLKMRRHRSREAISGALGEVTDGLTSQYITSMLGELRKRYKKTGDAECWRAALAVIDGMDLPHQANIGEAMMMLDDARRWEKALGLFQSCSKHEVEYNAQLYSAAVLACGKGGQWRQGLRLFCGMEEHGIEQTKFAHTSAIRACAEEGKWEVVLRLFDAAKKKHKGQVQSESAMPFCDVAMCNAVIQACSTASQSERAAGVLSEMNELGVKPDPLTFVALAASSGMSALTQLQEAKAKDMARKPLYHRAIRAFGDLSQWQAAFRVFLESPTGDTDKRSGATTISACAKGASVNAALAVLFEMRRRQTEPDVVCFNAALDACSRASDYTSAQQVLTDMLVRGLQPTALTLSALIKSADREGYGYKARELLAWGMRSGIEPDVFVMNTAIVACVEMEDSMSLLDEMDAMGIQYVSSTFNVALDACKHAESYTKLKDLFGWMDVIGVPRSLATFTSAISAFYQDSDADTIAGLLDQAPSRRQSDRPFFSVVLKACALPGLSERLMPLLREMHSLGVTLDPAMMASVRRALFSSGKGLDSADEQLLQLLGITPGKRVLDDIEQIPGGLV